MPNFSETLVSVGSFGSKKISKKLPLKKLLKLTPEQQTPVPIKYSDKGVNATTTATTTHSIYSSTDRPENLTSISPSQSKSTASKEPPVPSHGKSMKLRLTLCFAYHGFNSVARGVQSGICYALTYRFLAQSRNSILFRFNSFQVMALKFTNFLSLFINDS